MWKLMNRDLVYPVPNAESWRSQLTIVQRIGTSGAVSCSALNTRTVNTSLLTRFALRRSAHVLHRQLASGEPITHSASMSTIASDEKTSNARMPVWFLSHGGGPCFFMDAPDPRSPFHLLDKNSKATQWYKKVATTQKTPKPKAIVVFSAHWETSDTISVTSQEKPDLLYDYYGFPQHTYELKYPCPGAPALAKQIVGMLNKAGLKAKEDSKRNLDHGVFIPLKLIYPDADIPTLQVSLLNTLDPKTHIDIGKALAPLRDEGVLLIGSGFATHNLREITGSDPKGQFKAWMAALNAAVIDQPAEKRDEALLKWKSLPHAQIAHRSIVRNLAIERPAREEHLIPLHMAAGAAGADKAVRICDIWAGPAMSLTSYEFGGVAKATA